VVTLTIDKEESMEVGKEYIWNGIRSKLVSKWAQGNWFTFTFEDGRRFNGDPVPMFSSGELQAVAASAPSLLKPAVKLDPTVEPDWKKKKADPEILPVPSWLKKGDGDGKAPKS
jgi:hypothetical protein